MTERRLKRMRQRAEAAGAFPRCDVPSGVLCQNGTRGHWHSGPTWLMAKAEFLAAEGLADTEANGA